MARPRHLLIHHILPSSRSNGPGLRSVVWLQGCTLSCPGCFNPETHSFQQGSRRTVAAVALELIDLAPMVEGLTISGGEPFQQAPALASLLSAVRHSTNLSVLVFSGYTLGELQNIPQADAVLSQVDVLIAGRYDSNQRIGSGLLGSANKKIHFLTSRYNSPAIEHVPEAEIIIEKDGTMIHSGIWPFSWLNEKEGLD